MKGIDKSKDTIIDGITKAIDSIEKKIYEKRGKLNTYQKLF